MCVRVEGTEGGGGRHGGHTVSLCEVVSDSAPDLDLPLRILLHNSLWRFPQWEGIHSLGVAEAELSSLGDGRCWSGAA